MLDALTEWEGANLGIQCTRPVPVREVEEEENWEQVQTNTNPGRNIIMQDARQEERHHWDQP